MVTEEPDPMTRARRDVGERPACADHPGSRVYIDRHVRRSSNGFYGDIAFRCIHAGGKHLLTRPLLGPRTMTEQHPAAGRACPNCGQDHGAAAGQTVGRNYTYSVLEQARALVRVGRGDEYRKIAQTVHREALRCKMPPRPVCRGRAWLPRADAIDPKARRTRSKDYRYDVAREPGSLSGPYSVSATVVTSWVDVLAPAVLEAYAPTALPPVLAIDSLPIKRRSHAVDPGTGAVEAIPGGERNGEVMAVVDASVSPGQALALILEGSKDHQAWLRTFARLPAGDAPVWVVADLDNAIELAVTTAWPDAVLYRCEEHLRKRMRVALGLDGVPAKLSVEEAERLGVDVPEKARVLKRRGWVESVEHPLFRLVGGSVTAPHRWERLKRGVDKWLPDGGEAIRAWMAENEAALLGQMALRKANPDRPFSTGAAEGLLRRVETTIAKRGEFYANANRLSLVLGLMRLEALGLADEVRYSELIARWVEDRRGAGADWRSPRDVLGTSSIDDMIERAIETNLLELARREHDLGTRNALVQRKSAEVDPARVAAGLEPTKAGRVLRADGGHTYYRVKPGSTIADIPEIASQWRPELNEGKRAEDVAAGAGFEATWACAAHEASHGHLHIWRRRVIDRTTSRTMCPYCAGKLACPARCLPAQYAELMREWDWERNAAIDPDRLLPGSNLKVWWRCGVEGHDPFLQRIAGRTKQHSRCPQCFRGERKTKSVAEARAARQRGRELLREVSGQTKPPVVGPGPTIGFPEPDYLAVTDVAASLGREKNTIRNWIRGGRIAAVQDTRMGKPMFWIPPSEVERVRPYVENADRAKRARDSRGRAA